MQPCALAVCAFDAQGLGFLTLAGGLLGRVAFVASWRGPTQPNQVKKSSQVKSYILERRPPPPPSRLACRWIANRHGYIVHSALVRSHQSTSAGSVGICGVHEVLLAYAGHGTVAQHWTGTLCVCTHTIPVGPGTHIYGGHA